MPFRVTDSANSSKFAAQVARSQQRVEAAQERLASGKRINRPSDDPAGAGVVLRLRTTQATVEQFQRNVGTAQDTLAATDGALNSYEQILDRVRVLLTQGASDTTNAAGRAAIAAELDGLRGRILSVANTRHADSYLFGGTRQDAPPYDPSTAAPAATATSARLAQLEPGSPPVAVGTVAESVFADATGTIFDTLASASAALRGTGDPVADKASLSTALDRVANLSERAQIARTEVGVQMSSAGYIAERLARDLIALETNIQRVEAADLAESAIALTEATRALEATLQTGSLLKRPTLIDYLG